MRTLWVCAVAVAVLCGAASPVQAAPVSEAREAVFAAVVNRTDITDWDVFKRSCKRRSTSAFRCSFRAVSVDAAWEGRGTVRYVGGGYWRYNLKVRLEYCGPDGCRTQRKMTWKGRTVTFG